MIRYARAMAMRQDCVECHNRPEFLFQGRWKVGDFRGARQVSVPVLDVAPIIDAATITAVVIAILVSVLGGFFVLPVVDNLQKSMIREKSLAESLHQQNASLENANRAKSQMIAGLSHDLRTPLNAVIGLSGLMKNSRPIETEHTERETYPAIIHDSGQHLLALIEQILEISSLEGKSWEPQETHIDLESLLHSICPVFDLTLASANMTLDCQQDGPLPILFADERAIRRLVTNLVDNAIRYSGGNSIKILGSTSASGGVVISVVDDGVGMDLDQIHEMKQYGETSSSPSDSPQGNLGLGLWLVDLLMKAHGGAAEYCHSTGGGLTVTLSFPPERSLEAG